MAQGKKQTKAKVYDKIVSTRLDPEIIKAIIEQCKGEHRNISNMIKILILEALKARGVNEKSS